MSLIRETEEFVKSIVAEYDPSHDWNHIDRVRNNALNIAAKENCEMDIEIVELSALLHDIYDSKYCSQENKAAEEIGKFLSAKQYPQDKIDKIITIVNGISFHKEIASNLEEKEISIELKIVQDADRLDALGSIGLARVFNFDGAHKRPIYETKTDLKIPSEFNLPSSKEEYEKETNKSSVKHIHKKILTLRKLMKTKTGQHLADPRTDFMICFLEGLEAEVNGDEFAFVKKQPKHE